MSLAAHEVRIPPATRASEGDRSKHVASNSQAYLLVYLANRPGFPGDTWYDRGNDPELRTTPMTWGICRTNVRGWAREGTHLFFLAIDCSMKSVPIADRYYLTAYFRVAELIGHDEAVCRYPGRPNVILDTLPAGPSLADRVTGYITAHRHDLAWADAAALLADLDNGSTTLRANPAQHLHEIAGTYYIHSYWDCHEDWRRRLAAPYLVADEAASKVLPVPIPYRQIYSGCQRLPAPDALRTPRVHRHGARRVDYALDYLLQRIEDSQ